jgi:hypothetical protein
MSVELVDAAGRRRSPATLPGNRRGCSPHNKGSQYPADPPRVEEIIAVMRTAGSSVHGARVRALIVILWRAGLRINEALTLAETDLEPSRGRSWFVRGRAGSAANWGWTTGAGSTWSLGARFAGSCRSSRFCASLTAPLVAVPGRRPARGLNCGVWRRSPAFAGALRRISSAMRARSKWRVRGCRSQSSNGSSDMPTSASRAPTAGNRHERDHQHHPRATTADDPGKRGTPALSAGGAKRRSACPCSNGGAVCAPAILSAVAVQCSVSRRPVWVGFTSLCERLADGWGVNLVWYWAALHLTRWQVRDTRAGGGPWAARGLSRSLPVPAPR